jgi:CheY-like chemotaxis protein
MPDGTAEGGKRVILVVDDTASCATAIEVAVSNRRDTAIRIAGNGASAWKFLESGEGTAVCAVITDLDMPLMDGFELIRRIRSSTVHRNVPVIVVSGTTDNNASARALQAGANAFFGKPWSSGRMRATLEQLLYEYDGGRA